MKLAKMKLTKGQIIGILIIALTLIGAYYIFGYLLAEMRGDNNSQKEERVESKGVLIDHHGLKTIKGNEKVIKTW